ncbi:MAG: hypothetical protein ACFFD6_07455 [Candidatus Thorarchaeota archaeon]
MKDLFYLKLCTDGSAYEVRPRSRVSLDLPSIGDKAAEKSEMRIRVSLPAILILESDDGRTITIYPSGKLLLRKFPSEESVQKVTRLLVRILYS